MINEVLAQLKQEYPELSEEVLADALKRMSEVDPEGVQITAGQPSETPSYNTEVPFELQPYNTPAEEPAIVDPTMDEPKPRRGLEDLFKG